MKKPSFSVRFLDPSGIFHVENPDETTGLYFPLCNEAGLLSAITPSLHGDIKLDQHRFLTEPVSIENLQLSLASRNFWIVTRSTGWSVTGQSAWQKAKPGSEQVDLEAGFLWHRVERTNRSLGLKASVLNFVPSDGPTCEVMAVEITNTSRKTISFQAVSAIPFFGRSADNLRDHRHVTSLLHRLSASRFGLRLCPTMSFNERGHTLNQTSYYVAGVTETGRPPVGFFPTVKSFIGEGGSLERPAAIFENSPPRKRIEDIDQGQEAMGALVFGSKTLKPGQSTSFTVLLGIDAAGGDGSEVVRRFERRSSIREALSQTEAAWQKDLSRLHVRTGDGRFNSWIRWVQLQPTLRKIFGCSFLPDFDYGRGGRGWRDLWQDCLALLLFNPGPVRELIRRNFAGVRMDGSNATIIGTNNDFIADRNNITRTWMDHGTWPFLTTQLYVDQTGDYRFLLEKAPYFRDAQLHRGRRLDEEWLRKNPDSALSADACTLQTPQGTPYLGTLFEHMLVETVVQFFNIGEHNNIRLEDADWNDGLDMAGEHGESVAFSHLYAANLSALADMAEKLGSGTNTTSVSLAKEILSLLDRVTGPAIDYDRIPAKRHALEKYFEDVSSGPSGETAVVAIDDLAADLRAKATWMRAHLNRQEWVEVGGYRWFNGYYDNEGRRVEGKDEKGRVRLTLTGQVYAIMGGTADADGVGSIIKAVDRYLFDKNLGGFRLNTNFGALMPSLGRAFSFAYGEKENGAVFSHMVVMYANALYQRGFVEEGHRVLSSLFRMATNFQRSRIFPGIPEYFNNEGRGRYHYLTGSASWYVLTVLTQVFGVRGEGGDLRLAPKLEPDQFDRDGEASVTTLFAGAKVAITYKNAAKVPYKRMKISSIQDSDRFRGPDRETIRERSLGSSIIFSQQTNRLAHGSLGLMPCIDPTVG